MYNEIIKTKSELSGCYNRGVCVKKKKWSSFLCETKRWKNNYYDNFMPSMEPNPKHNRVYEIF